MKLGLTLITLFALIPIHTCLNDFVQQIELDRLPPCAVTCEAIQSVTIKCLPTATPSAAPNAFHHCVCALGLNRSPHLAGSVCKNECNNIENAEIKEYFRALCALPEPPHTTLLDVVTSTVLVSPTAEKTSKPSSLAEFPPETSITVATNVATKYVTLRDIDT